APCASGQERGPATVPRDHRARARRPGSAGPSRVGGPRPIAPDRSAAPSGRPAAAPAADGRLPTGAAPRRRHRRLRETRSSSSCRPRSSAILAQAAEVERELHRAAQRGEAAEGVAGRHEPQALPNGLGDALPGALLRAYQQVLRDVNGDLALGLRHAAIIPAWMPASILVSRPTRTPSSPRSSPRTAARTPAPWL